MRHFVLFIFLAVIPVALDAQAGCPANLKAIPLRKFSQHQMVVGVSLNHSGPYDFLLDTGTQMTVVDLSLAADLHLTAMGNAKVAGVSIEGPAMFAKLDRLEVGDHVAIRQDVLVYNMKNVQGAGFAIRGLLGEDFLSGYDVLIDKTHNVLCIDDTGEMLKRIQGQREPLNSTGGSAGAASHIIAAP
jgi:Aspartyl protease